MKLLYISTFFHDYHTKIINLLVNKLSNEVDLFYLERKSFLASFLRTISTSKYRNFRQNQYKKLLSFSDEYDIIFIQSPYIIDIEILIKMRKKHNSSTFISYSWDSIKRTNESDYFEFFDKFYSFDPFDCSRFPKLKYLPLFYVNEFSKINIVKSYDLAFIGGIGDSKDRYNFLKEVKKQCKVDNIVFFCYPRIPLAFYVKSLLKREFYRGVKFKRITLESISDVYKRSKCVLDHHNILQNGLTIRTFEAIASGCRLVTTNKTVINEPFFDERYIDIIDRNNPILSKDFITSRMPIDEVYLERFVKYSIENWIKIVFYEKN